MVMVDGKPATSDSVGIKPAIVGRDDDWVVTTRDLR